MDINEYLREQKAKKDKAIAECNSLERTVAKVKSQYPNVEIKVSRWGRATFVVPDLDPQHVGVSNSCSCCFDADVLLTGYTTIEPGLSVSTPTICIGDKNFWKDDWQSLIPKEWSHRAKFIKEIADYEPRYGEDE